MPVYRMTVTIEFESIHDDPGDRENAIFSAIQDAGGRIRSDNSAERVDTPTQPDEDGQ